MGDLAAEVWMDESALGSEKELRGGKSGCGENIPAFSRMAVRADKRGKDKMRRLQSIHDEYSLE